MSLGPMGAADMGDVGLCTPYYAVPTPVVIERLRKHAITARDHVCIRIMLVVVWFVCYK